MADRPNIVSVDAGRAGLAHDPAALRRSLAGLPPGAPVLIMIHGYRYSPGTAAHCPHSHIFSLNPPPGIPRVISWPRHLGIDRGAGLAIAFGWPARGWIGQAYARAARAGEALAELIRAIHAIRPGQPVDIIAHSLGARVALQSLPLLPPHSLRHLILMAAGEFRRPARRALATPAGETASILNVTTRENDLFDALLEWLVGAGTQTALGMGLGQPARNWTEVQIDQPATRAALRSLGYSLPPPARRICHWSPYLRPGAFTLYRDLIAGHLSPATLRAALPSRPDPRWSRLIASPLHRAAEGP